jgi:biopolymer transport protein ExbD
MGAARSVTRTTKPRNIAASALSILAACNVPSSALSVEAPRVLVTMDPDAGENGLCHVHYEEVDRTAPCTKIAALMQADRRIPAHAHVILRGSKTARYEQVAGLLQALRDAGYTMKLGYINAR